MVRVAMNLPKELLVEFDEKCKENGCKSRNEGLQMVMNQFVKQIKDR